MAETKSWATIKPSELKEMIIDLAKQGITAEKIGLVLRDKHAVPKAKLLGVRIKQVLQEKNLWSDPEQSSYEKKLDKLTKHINVNKHDHTAKRSFVKNSQHFNKIKKSQSAS